MIRNMLLISVVASSLLIANEAKKLDNITVTANKIEENLQDIPQSITVINEEILEEKGIKNIDGIIREIPNMLSDKSGTHGNAVSFRGLNASTFTNNNPVVIYVDGVPYYDRFDFAPSLANVERVEILRGPQGTLYGKDAMGAVINIVTKSPSNEWSGQVGAEYGSNNYMESSLSANGALIDDKVWAGFSAFGYKDDGWITNHYEGMDKDANYEDNINLSAFISFKPTDRFSGKLTVSHNEEELNFIKGYAFAPDVKFPESFKRDDAKHASFDVPSPHSSKVDTGSLNLAYNFDSFKLESTTTYKKVKNENDFDIDFSDNQMLKGLKQFHHEDKKNFAEELKASGETQSFKWIAGLYFDDETINYGPYGMQLPNFNPKTNKFLGNYTMNAVSETKANTKALFAQTMIPFMKKFELTLGGRYQKVEKDMNLNVYYHKVGATPTLMFPTFAVEKDWDVFLPKVGLSYKLDDKVTFYASYSQGYMPGGFNYFASSPDKKANTFEPQRSSNYEAGIKFASNNLMLNLAVFRMDIKDMHIYKAVSQNIWLTDNAKKAHSQGFEIDGRYLLTSNWELSGSLGLIDAKYDDYDLGMKKLDGQRIERTPRYTGNIGLAYVSDAGFYGRVDLHGKGKTSFFESTKNSLKTDDGAVLANIKLGYKIKDFDIYTYVNNITDEEYITDLIARPGLGLVTFNEPRKFGLGVRYKF